MGNFMTRFKCECEREQHYSFRMINVGSLSVNTSTDVGKMENGEDIMQLLVETVGGDITAIVLCIHRKIFFSCHIEYLFLRVIWSKQIISQITWHRELIDFGVAQDNCFVSFTSGWEVNRSLIYPNWFITSQVRLYCNYSRVYSKSNLDDLWKVEINFRLMLSRNDLVHQTQTHSGTTAQPGSFSYIPGVADSRTVML